jgi:hypothetical protein
VATHPEYKVLSKHYWTIVTTLIVRDDYRCCWCGDRRRALRVDHIVPVKRGGLTIFDNLQFLCHRCNMRKGNEIMDYRPTGRGTLGITRPWYGPRRLPIIRVECNGSTYYRPAYIEAELLGLVTKEAVAVQPLRRAGELRVKLQDVYPPDLQFIFQAL